MLANLVVDKTKAVKKHRCYELENILGFEYKVLDSGFIRVIDFLGNEESITQAARVSYGKGTKSVNKDKNLIDRLLRDNHSSPFEMPVIRFHIKLPIFVARQWIRHRTASVNEYSARYSVLDNEFYVPKEWRGQSKENKQGSYGYVTDVNTSNNLSFSNLDNECAEWYNLNLENGMTRELARTRLNLACYTQWYWQINLRNLLHFLNLRGKPDAQLEIVEYVKIIEDIVKIWCPNVFTSWVNHQRDSITFSKQELGLLYNLINDGKLNLLPKYKGLIKNNIDNRNYNKFVNKWETWLKSHKS